MSVTETILQSITFAFDTTKVIQIYESTKLFRLKFVNNMNFFYIYKNRLTAWQADLCCS